jgi:hypothetical protein
MRLTAQVEFYPPGTQLVEPGKPKEVRSYPLISMTFNSLPHVGHIIESPSSKLPVPLYRVAGVLHTIHGVIYLKVIPA